MVCTNCFCLAVLCWFVSDDNVCLTMDQISAQAFVFIIGGFETSALTQSWALYELAVNPFIQHRLQAEIDTLDQWTYKNIQELNYLEMILNGKN